MTRQVNAIQCDQCKKLVEECMTPKWHDKLLAQRYAFCSNECRDIFSDKKKASLKKIKFGSPYVGEIDVETLDGHKIGVLFSGYRECWTYKQNNNVRLETRHMKQIANKMEKLENERKNR